MRVGQSVVYMNYGRWVVDCSNPECTWAYSAMSTEDGSIWLPWQRTYVPRPLTLLNCNGDENGPGCGWRVNLEWPERDEALEIERLLFARPLKANRNWKPPETVETLLAENGRYLVGWTVRDLVEHGIGVV